VTKKRRKVEGEFITEYTLGDLESHRTLMDRRAKVQLFEGCMVD
jgi:hypothetical protein